jgi:hypothetical protein
VGLATGLGTELGTGTGTARLGTGTGTAEAQALGRAVARATATGDADGTGTAVGSAHWNRVGCPLGTGVGVASDRLPELAVGTADGLLARGVGVGAAACAEAFAAAALLEFLVPAAELAAELA